MPIKKKKNKKLKRTLLPVGGNDEVYTPYTLADNIVKHFQSQITGKVLEPCEGVGVGSGAFTKAFAKYDITDTIALEIRKGLDFFEFNEKVNWIITNPPWSLARKFMKHSFELSENVVLLITLNHVIGLRARLLDMEKAGFGIKEILLCDTPVKPWPQSGFQLGIIHFKKGYSGEIAWRRLLNE